MHLHMRVVAGWEPLCHKQMVRAPIFTTPTPKRQDSSTDKKWQNRGYVNADTAAQQEPVN